MKLTGYTNAYNSLTNFEYDWSEWIDRKRKLCEFAETCWEKKSWNHFKLTNFWRIWAIWNHCGPPALFQPDPMKTFVQSSIEYLHGLITRQTNVDKDRSKVFKVIQLPSKSLIDVHFNIKLTGNGNYVHFNINYKSRQWTRPPPPWPFSNNIGTIFSKQWWTWL